MRLTALFIMIAMLLHAPAFGAARRSRLALHVALSAPLTPDLFQETWQMGFGGGGSLSLLVKPRLWVVGDFDAYWFAIDQDKVSGADISGGGASVSYAAAGVRFELLAPERRRVVPYLLAGAGLFGITFDEVTAAGATVDLGAETENAAGVHAGAGVSISPFFVELLYLTGFTTDVTAVVPLRAGVAIDL